jgi:hypothetical protein
MQFAFRWKMRKQVNAIQGRPGLSMPRRLFVSPILLVCRTVNHIPKKEADMDSGMIGKIQKSKLYAQEPERILFDEFRVTFQGTNGNHVIRYDHGTWQCTCNFFASRGVCSHTMAMERVLGVMLPPEAMASAEPVPAYA